MESNYQKFWQHKSFALIGNSATRKFPELTFNGLKSSGKTVFAIDPSADSINGSQTFPSLSEIPQPVEAVVVEVPKGETLAAVESVIEAGIKNLWIHMGTDTPEAVEAAQKAGLNLCYGTCAVMYVNNTGMHKFHGWINKVFKKY